MSWAYILNFSFLGHVKVTFPPKLAIWLRKTKPSQPKKTKPPKPFKHPWINIFLWVEAACKISASQVMFKLYFLPRYVWRRKTKPTILNEKRNQHNCPGPTGLSFFVRWAYMPNFGFLGYFYVIFPTKISIWLRKTKLTKPNQKPNQSNSPNPLKWSYFCELRLHPKFQLPRLCLSYISMVEENKRRKTSWGWAVPS